MQLVLKKLSISAKGIAMLLSVAIIFFTNINLSIAESNSASSIASEKISSKQERPDEDFKKKLIATIAKSENSFADEFDAEVWLFEQAKRLEKVAPHIPEDERFTILQMVHSEASKAGLDPLLVLALINVESDFDHYAISSAGALGLMQVMPFWKDEIGHPDDNLHDIDTNLRYGCAILSLYLAKEKKDMTLALARYNGSRGKYWYPMRIYKAQKRTWHP